jgi:hypothetical protein
MEIFQSFWHGGALPPFAIYCIDSFVKGGQAFHLYTYDDVDVPVGVIRKDARDIFPEDRIFYFKNENDPNGSIACFSDLFRYKLLKEKGHW